jgi:hypothetical protein
MADIPPDTPSPVIRIDWSDEPPPTYANGAQVLNTQREFAILFTDFMAFAGRGNAPVDGVPNAKVVANLRLTPDVFFQVTAAMASNWNRYANQFVAPGQPRPKFKLMGAGGQQLEGLEPPTT